MTQEHDNDNSDQNLVIQGHVVRRCQQRGIAEDTVRMLHRYGKKVRRGDGYSFWATRKTHEKAEQELGSRRYGEIARQIAECYIVTLAGEPVVKTAAWKRQRLRN